MNVIPSMERIKRLQKNIKKNLNPGSAGKGVSTIFEKKGREYAREFARLVKRVLPTANPVEIQEKYSGGGFGYDAHYGVKDLPLHEIARINILGKLASTILAYKYGIPLEDAAELVERDNHPIY